MDRTRLKADLTLFLVAAIWGSSFAVQRQVASSTGPFLFNGSGRQPQIKDVFRFHTGFVFANEATSTVFSRNPRFDMLALLVVV